MAEAGVALACDLGGTNLRVALVDGAGTIRAAEKRTLVDRAPEAVVALLAALAGEVLRGQGTTIDRVAAVGIGVAGPCLGATGVVVVAPNLGWRDVPFGAMVERALGRRVRVVNDLSAAAWGEAAVGGARGAKDVVLIFVGSGVGSGLILDGRLYEGCGGLAGEFGHTKVVAEGGRLCGCGEHGCLEAYAGGHNIARRLRELAAEGRAAGILRAAGGDPDRLGGAALERAAEEGDPEAVALRDEIGRMLGVQIANVVTLLNPARLILGGGVLTGMPGLKARAIDWIRRATGRPQLARLTVLDAALGDDAGLIGAGLLALAGEAA